MLGNTGEVRTNSKAAFTYELQDMKASFLHSSDLCGHWMPSRGFTMSNDQHIGMMRERKREPRETVLFEHLNDDDDDEVVTEIFRYQMVSNFLKDTVCSKEAK